jgi:hypothetical protein
MKPRTLLTFLFLCLVTSGFGHFQSAVAADQKPTLNFDTQLIAIFESVQTEAPAAATRDEDQAAQQVLARILAKLKSRAMVLKNVVYRTDMGVIRVTWADDDNDDIVKAAYKTGKDPILSNSVYADKQRLVDIKIIYRASSGSYQYLRIENNALIQADRAQYGLPTTAPRDPRTGLLGLDYLVEGRLTKEKCAFCHEIARSDGSRSGIFFPRYQEIFGEPTHVHASGLFDAARFAPQPKSMAETLGLAPMSEDFVYQKVDFTDPQQDQDVATRFARTLFELPQLIEVMARDNGNSICVALDFGSFAEKAGFGRNDYVCADNAAQRLYVRLSNRLLTVHAAPVEYSEPYFKK